MGRGRTTTLAAAVALALAGLAAACASGPGTAGAPSPTPPSPAEVQAALTRAGASGPGVEVWIWAPGFVAGDRGAAPLARALEWVAPTGPAGSPTGTVTVWRDPAGDGSLATAATSDDAELAQALATVGAHDVLVTDRSDWLVVADGTVRPLLSPPRGDLAGPMSVDEYRGVLAARAREHDAYDGPGSDTIGG